MSLGLKDVEQMAKQEFLLRSGTRVFDIPCKQLFDYSDRGALRIAQTSELNRSEIARLALNFKDCGRTSSGVSLRDSLTLGDNGATLIKATGSKLLCAVSLTPGGSFNMTGHILYMDLKPNVLPDDVGDVLHTLQARADFSKAIYLELVCATANTGAATLLLICLLKKLDGAKTGVLADAVNESSDEFFKKFGFTHIRKNNPSIWWMSKADAIRLARKTNGRAGEQKGLVEHLRVHKSLKQMCVRKGVTNATSHREFWDCR